MRRQARSKRQEKIVGERLEILSLAAVGNLRPNARTQLIEPVTESGSVPLPDPSVQSALADKPWGLGCRDSYIGADRPGTDTGLVLYD